ncbi:MAG: hypothetical protein AAFY65_13410 [Pseudomonadota bacterium]
MDPRAHPCRNCGDPIAPYGFRRSGSYTRLPLKKRTYVWVCYREACQERAKDWVARAEGLRRTPLPPLPTRTPSDPQGSLL